MICLTKNYLRNEIWANEIDGRNLIWDEKHSAWAFPRKVFHVQQFVNSCWCLRKFLEPKDSVVLRYVLFKVMPSLPKINFSRKFSLLVEIPKLSNKTYFSEYPLCLVQCNFLVSSISFSRIIKHDSEQRFELRSSSNSICLSCFRRLYLIVSFTEHNCRSCWIADYQITTLKMISIHPENVNWKV